MDELLVLNMILIIVIVIALVMHVIKQRTDLKKQQADVVELQRQIKEFSLLDLHEFSKLNPTIKAMYKQYVVERIMAALMDEFSSQVTAGSFDEYLKVNSSKIEELVNKLVETIKNAPTIPINKKDIDAMISGIQPTFPEPTPIVEAGIAPVIQHIPSQVVETVNTPVVTIATTP